jgi:hypothetical protein
MTQTFSTRPRALSIVAIYMLAAGGLAALGALLQRNPFALIVATAVIATGVGLLKLKPGWRIAALTWFGLMMGLAVVSLIVLLRSGGSTRLLLPRVANPGMNALVTVVCFIVAALCYHALTRPRVKAAFGVK